MKTRTLKTPAGNVQIVEQMRTREEIEAKLKEIMSDERLGYERASIFSNAPLAIIQTHLAAQVSALRWVLDL